MEYMPEPKVKDMLMKMGTLDFGDGEITDLKEEFRVQNKLIDIIGINRELGRFYIIEIKSKTANYLALEQLLMYREYFAAGMLHSPEYHRFEIQCYLIAGKCNQSMAIKYLNPRVRFIDYRTMQEAKHWQASKSSADDYLFRCQGNALSRIFPEAAEE